MASAVAAARDHESRIDTVEEFVAERLVHCDDPDAVVRACVARIRVGAGQVGTDEMVASAGIGRRQLERRFAVRRRHRPALLAAISAFAAPSISSSTTPSRP